MSVRLRRKLVHFVSRDGTREIRVKLHASFVWPASTVTRSSKPRRGVERGTDANNAARGNTVQPLALPPSHSAMRVLRANAETPRL